MLARLLTSACLLLWGAVLIGLHLSGRLPFYLLEDYRPYVIIAGIALCLLALLNFLCGAPSAPMEDAENTSEARARRALEGHDHSLRLTPARLFSYAILMGPITLASLFAPDSYGRAAVENRAAMSSSEIARVISSRVPSPALAAVKDTPPAPVTSIAPPLPSDPEPVLTTSAPAPPPLLARPAEPEPSVPPATTPAIASYTDPYDRTPEGYLKAEVVDLLYAAEEPVLMRDFDQKKIDMIGQFLPAKDGNRQGDRFRLTRLFMTCCAADARPVSILVQFPANFKNPEFKDMAWLRIKGVASFPLEDGQPRPLLQAESVETCAPPEEPMLY